MRSKVTSLYSPLSSRGWWNGYKYLLCGAVPVCICVCVCSPVYNVMWAGALVLVGWVMRSRDVHPNLSSQLQGNDVVLLISKSISAVVPIRLDWVNFSSFSFLSFGDEGTIFSIYSKFISLPCALIGPVIVAVTNVSLSKDTWGGTALFTFVLRLWWETLPLRAAAETAAIDVCCLKWWLEWLSLQHCV